MEDMPPSSPPPRPKGGELSVGRRIALAVEVALAIPPGKVRLPKCIGFSVGPQCLGFSVVPPSVLVLVWGLSVGSILY